MNKKLLKLIMCIASGMGFVSSIPFAATSCGCSSEKINPLPESVYDINENNVLLGFKEGIDLTQYKDACNTMQIPANVTSVGDRAFIIQNPATQEYETTIPSFIKNLTFAENSNCSAIGDYAFVSSPFVSIILPDKLSEIKNYGFAYCPSLTSVNLLKCTKLSSIGDGAFGICNSIKDIKIDNNFYHVEQLGKKGKAVISGKKEQTSWTNTSIAVGCLACGDIQLPSNISSIANNAFTFCSSLTSVDLSNNTNLLNIGKYAFTYCLSLTSVTFPSSLTSIGKYSLKNCSNLNYIAWNLPNDYDTNISIMTEAFSGISSSGTVTSLNPSITSQQLLEWIKTKGDFPSGDGWKAAD